MQITERTGSIGEYRYGFQGQEKDDEIKGEGNSLNYTFRMHDPRIGRFFAVDPLEPQYPWYSPYQFSGNRPIDKVELEGLEPADPGTKEGEMREARTKRPHGGNILKMRTKGNPKKEWFWHQGTEHTEKGWYKESEYELTQLDYTNGQVLPEAAFYEFGIRKIKSDGSEAGSGDFYSEVDQQGYLNGKTGINPIYLEMPWYIGNPAKGPAAVKSLAAASKLGNLYFRTRGLAYAFLKRIKLNLPKSQAPIAQWTITDDILKKGFEKSTGFIYNKNATHVGKFQLFKTENGYRVIVKHVKDGDVHYHAGKASVNGKEILFKSSDEAIEWFQTNNYTKIDDVKHFYTKLPKE